MDLRYITHFAGVGGACHGLHQAGLKCVVAIDCSDLPAIDKEGRPILDRNGHQKIMGDGPCIQVRQKLLGDAAGEGLKIRIEDYFLTDEKKKYIHAKEEHFKDIFLIWSSPPCKKFSQANKASAADLRLENLYRETLKSVAIIRPKFFILENVKGLLSHGDKLLEIMNAFEKEGYHVEWKLLDSRKDFGLAQHRERIFIIGSRDGHRRLFPNKDFKIKPKLFSEIRCNKATDWALNDHSYWTMNEKISKLVKKNGNFKIRVIGCKKHQGTSADFMPTVTCGWGGGITRKKIAVADCIVIKRGQKRRRLWFLRHPTLLEAIKGQGMPEEWLPILEDQGKTFAFNLVGNAVSCPVSKALAEHLVKIDQSPEDRTTGRGSDDLDAYRKMPKKVKAEKVARASGSVKFLP